ncbi:hypothetical protein ACVDFE_04855 [Lentzea chajnantorensis]
MNTPQVSVWIPIIVGVIGLVGVIAGQLINSRREDRRWRLEQEREELRWKREIAKEADMRREANRAHWRDKKFETYSEILAFTKRWHDAILDGSTAILANEKLPSDLKERLEEAGLEHIDYQDQVDLLATDEQAQGILREALGTYSSFTHQILDGTLPERDGQIGSGAFWGDATEIINDVITAIRLDLGIAHEKDRTFSPHVREVEQRKGT